MSEKRTRRSILSAGFGSIAGLNVASLVVEGKPNDETPQVDTGFDPTDWREVKRFLSAFLDLQRAKQEEVFRGLTERQKAVVARCLGLKTINVTTVGGVTDDSNRSSHSQTFVLSGKSWSGETIWNYHHDIRYEYTGSGCPIDITRVTNSTWATNVSFGWSYDGDVSESTNIITGGCGGSDEARALAQGKFSYALNGVAYTANPLSRLAGSTRYRFDRSRYVPDAWEVETRCDYCDGTVS